MLSGIRGIGFEQTVFAGIGGQRNWRVPNGDGISPSFLHRWHIMCPH